jgi:hypothetical protein
VVSFTPRPLYLSERAPGTHWGSRTGLEHRPIGSSNLKTVAIPTEPSRLSVLGYASTCKLTLLVHFIMGESILLRM